MSDDLRQKVLACVERRVDICRRVDSMNRNERSWGAYEEAIAILTDMRKLLETDK